MSQDNAGHYKKALLWVWLLSCVVAIPILGLLHASIQIAVSSEGTKLSYATALLSYFKDVFPSVSATIVAFLVVYTLYYFRLAPSQLATNAVEPEQENLNAAIATNALHAEQHDVLVRQCGVWVELFKTSPSPDFSIGCFYRDENGRFHYDGTRFGSGGSVQHHWHSKVLACADNSYVLYIYKRPGEKDAAIEGVPYTDGMGVIYIRPAPDTGKNEFKVARFSDRNGTVVDVEMRKYDNIAHQSVLEDAKVSSLLSLNGVDEDGRVQLGRRIAGQFPRAQAEAKV